MKYHWMVGPMERRGLVQLVGIPRGGALLISLRPGRRVLDAAAMILPGASRRFIGAV